MSRAMHSVLSRCQQRLGTWVGSSVVHLGDHNVPNALMFIDKYTQVRKPARLMDPVHASRNSPVLNLWQPMLTDSVPGSMGLAEISSLQIRFREQCCIMAVTSCACGLQVPRILNPVVLVLDALPKHCKDPKLASYVNSLFGSVEGCRKAILLDFFRHAFDGSGADNFVSTLPASPPCMSCTIPLFRVAIRDCACGQSVHPMRRALLFSLTQA